MGSFDAYSRAKQYGAITYGLGPPAPVAGVVGDIYVDAQTNFLYNKRADDVTSPWGNYLFEVPVDYRTVLKWFSASNPGNEVGAIGDYCLLWSGYANYGTQPSIYGPKTIAGWPENGIGLDLVFDPLYLGAALPAGIEDEGVAAPYSTSTQLVVVGLADEYILAIPVAMTVTAPVPELGLQGQPVNVPVTLNPLYAAIDEHTV